MTSRRRVVASLPATVLALGLLSGSLPLGGSGDAKTGHPVEAAAAVPYAATGAPWARVVALGDSVPAGQACACPGYPKILANRIAGSEQGRVAALNLAFGGATSGAALVHALWGGLGDPHGRVTVVTVGANDFSESAAWNPGCAQAVCWSRQLVQMDANIRAILRAIGRSRNGVSPTQAPVVVTGYWNVFRDGLVGRRQGATYVANSDALTRQVNMILSRAALAYGQKYADLYAPFKGRGNQDATPYLAADGDHPNIAGHELIEQSISRALAR